MPGIRVKDQIFIYFLLYHRSRNQLPHSLAERTMPRTGLVGHLVELSSEVTVGNTAWVKAECAVAFLEQDESLGQDG